jgi:hypothetical protein
MQGTEENIMRHKKDAICLPDNYGKNTDTHVRNLLLLQARQPHPL